MSSTARVLWLDGLPLAPQHFQEADRLHAEALDARFRAMHRCPWGLRRLSLDPRSLREGVIRVDRLESVFADGTVAIVGPGSELTIKDRAVTGLGTDRAEVMVHVAIVRARRGRPDVGIEGARLRTIERASVDTHTEPPAEPVTVEIGVPALRIVFGHEAREDLETIPLLCVRRDELGQIRDTGRIVGPLLALGASEPLVARLTRLVERLGARRAALLVTRHERDAETIEVDPGDLTRFVLASAIATHHPVLRHRLVRGDGCLASLFEQLLALAGALSVLAVDAALEVPDLDPLEPDAAFGALFDRIDTLLTVTDRERARSIALEPRADGLHFARLDDACVRAERFYLAVRSVLTPRDVEGRLGGLAKVASYGEIAGVLETATPGAPLQVVHRPPPEIPMRAGETCFELSSTDRFFRAAIAERGIAVYLPARDFDPAHTQLTLVALARHGSDRATDRSAALLGG
jgi:type VI secretion system protein ImpJ